LIFGGAAVTALQAVELALVDHAAAVQQVPQQQMWELVLQGLMM